MQRFTTAQRMRYRFDNTMSRGTIALIGWLFALSAVLIVVISLVVSIFGAGPQVDDQPAGFRHMVWMSLMRTLDSGTMGGDDGNMLFLGAMLTVTLGGIFVVSTLIGVLSSGIESRLDELRKGRSFVIERNHTVIFGWSPQIFPIVSELAKANASNKNACIAVLAEKDKVEMEDELRAKVPDMGTTRIVCRTGNPADLSDLAIVNPHDARAIIILPPENENPDSQVIKTILALTNNPQRRAQPYHIVSGMSSLKNLQVAQQVAKGEAELVLVGDLIARIIAQTCRQSGLSVVYNDLLDFDGDEIYFFEDARLVGQPFSATLLAFETSCVIGLRFADGRVLLNPPGDTQIAAGDKLVVIAEDDSKIKLSESQAQRIDLAAIAPSRDRVAPPERTLILGWNERACPIITELDNYVASGSEVLAVAEHDEAAQTAAGCGSALQHQALTFQLGDTTDRATLDTLDIARYNHVIVLSDTRLSIQDSDARTLMTLLHLREIAAQAAHSFTIVSEMLDVRNRELAEVTQADDFIVTDRFVSLMLSQIAENKDLAKVFEDLFSPEGSEIYLKPASDYVALGTPVNFYTLIEAARQRGEVALGYRVRSEEQMPYTYGVRLNPLKSQMVTFAEADKLIVLAES